MTLYHKTLSNGLKVVVEEMPHVESVSYEISIPGGLISDDADSVGGAIVFAEILSKGAGQYDSRCLAEEFDQHGIRHGEGSGLNRFTLAGSAVGSKYQRALELTSLMIQSPSIPDGDIGPIKSILLQDLEALRDNPARRAMVELTKRFYPAPFNRSSLGDKQGIAHIDKATLDRIHEMHFKPEGSIVSVAGNVRADEVFGLLEELFSEWKGHAPSSPVFSATPKDQYYHIDDSSAQVQIVMANRSVPFGAPLYYEGKLVASILGSSMFGRLFMEVREKRGLCYSVYARHGSTNEYGTMTAYVGTTPERAQESLDVMLGEFNRLSGTIEEFELERAKTNLKASLIMGEESPASRASSNASDWWLLRRIRPLAEIQAAIDSVTLDSIEEFLKEYPFRSSSILTLGSCELKIDPSVISVEEK